MPVVDYKTYCQMLDTANKKFQAVLDAAVLGKLGFKGLQFLAAYTWSKSFDDASSFENTLDPLCFRADSALGVAGIISAWRAGKRMVQF